jgi:nuclear receptor subfamily 0 group A
MMMLRLDEYAKQQPAAAASPSISSPDSHNSDSSIEIGDKRNSLLSTISSKQNNSNKQHVPNTQSQQLHQQPSPLALNKDLFLPLPFAGFPFPMPPPGFLAPPTHFLFSSYHNALYEQNHHLLQQQVQQGLLKTATAASAHDLPSAAALSSAKSPTLSERSVEETSHHHHHQHQHQKKRHYTETLLDLHRSRSEATIKLPKRSDSPLELMMSGHHHNNNNNSINNSRHHRSNHSEDEEEEDIDMNNDESDEVLTPPRSPKTPNQTLAAENNPIDLSMKSGSSTKSDDINHNYYKAKTNNNNNINNSPDSPSDNFTVSMNGGGGGSSSNNSDSDSNDHHHHKANGNNRKTIHCHVLKDDGKQQHESMNGGCDESEEDSDDKSFKHRHHHHRYDDEDDKSGEYEVELKRRKLHLAAPLDLTTKV